MSTAYEKAFEIELLSEYSSMVYAEALNYMLDHDLEHTKPNHFLVDLVNQMELNLTKDYKPFQLIGNLCTNSFMRHFKSFTKQ